MSGQSERIRPTLNGRRAFASHGPRKTHERYTAVRRRHSDSRTTPNGPPAADAGRHRVRGERDPQSTVAEESE